uniref:Photosynthesis system II assembly factor Ycf48/Hcf136-like domain-containing protein n=1 Tax=Rhodosorus marinus TaxID=101924 RepID=A0A7S3EIV7_9RHOD|mmetsp:Transcript_39461/g.156694  ORF Transcript_39461/g.156694 Transcript_39461/m.156694 type:complete len:400 (+) Transcript_39461:175-1374(+)|eukprot:CAMPEP_0113960270 /NCGR_PEP_ID=MMETSP0011_2-20120614/4619_1 /TAXON_ID=101924 /ORGANISM="Rhodosorus marinus" /LENGTH=399 /DNA_ID=CAMNT_0000971699 /DNA_START=62 /DNA_END=1261 /DNA_ORIENTATION=- /assembly_acc=CAM_ASM_000156
MRTGFVGSCVVGEGVRQRSRVVCSASEDASVALSRRELLKSAAAGIAAAVAAGSALPDSAIAADVSSIPKGKWSRVNLPFEGTLFDLSFIPQEPSHGWLIGTKGSVFETIDYGQTWMPRSFQNLDPEEEINYRFQEISFNGSEGWVIGKPSILLHTRDGGKSWERVSLSPKLPGDPCSITALGRESAEMTTTAGAVYVTTNSGLNWKAQVKETIDATLNRTVSSGVTGASYFTGSIISVLRDSLGAYIAVSSRGNFYLTWKPGQEFWVPHGRDSSKRIQGMGFVNDDVNKGIWMSLRGGDLVFSEPNPDILKGELDFKKVNLKSGGYGILDVAFRPGTDEVWASVGGGQLFVSYDGGKTWSFDKQLGKVGALLYKIIFVSKDVGFALGANGVLLRYSAA